MSSYSAQELFGDFSDNEGFSDDDGHFSTEGTKLFRKLSAQPCKVNNYSDNNFNNSNKATNKDTWKSKNSNVSKDNSKTDAAVREMYSGINIMNPLISSEELRLLMQGRKMVKLSLLKTHINKKTNDVDDDWVTMGILVSKQTKVSKNGNDYSLWKLSDLKSDKFASLFLFGGSNEKHWKLPIGAVVGLLNATIMNDNKDFKGKAAEMCSLTLDNPDKLLHIGTSKDMGYCKAVKKNGEVCGNLIAKSEDEFCLYHIKNAYRKYSSKRAELQTSFANKEPEDFHFSNNYTPNVTLNQKNIVIEMKNVNKRQLASKKTEEGKSLKKVLSNPISLAAQNLAAYSSGKVTKEPNKQSFSPLSFNDFFDKMKEMKSTSSDPPTPSISEKKQPVVSPALAKGYKRGQSIDLHFRASDAQMSAAKKRAIEIFKNRPTAAPKPATTSNNSTTSIKLTTAPKNKKLQDILKRVNQNVSESNDELAKEQLEAQKEKSKLIEAALQRKSVNQSVVNVIESEAEERYFNGLEKKERYESRLIELNELPVKVVTCAICKYTAASQGDMCKAQSHPVDLHRAVKRFFSCKDCKTHTYTLDSIRPTKACKKCGGTNYGKAGSIKDKTETKLVKDLLIRGEEMKFLNSLKS